MCPGPDGYDVQFTVKGLASDMQAPTRLGMARLRRLVRYLCGTLHIGMLHMNQEAARSSGPTEGAVEKSIGPLCLSRFNPHSIECSCVCAVPTSTWISFDGSKSWASPFAKRSASTLADLGVHERLVSGTSCELPTCRRWLQGRHHLVESRPFSSVVRPCRQCSHLRMTTWHWLAMEEVQGRRNRKRFRGGDDPSPSIFTFVDRCLGDPE